MVYLEVFVMVILWFVQTCFSGFIFIGLSYATKSEREKKKGIKDMYVSNNDL